MNRWNIDIMGVNMPDRVRVHLRNHPSVRSRLQEELDRLLPFEFDGYAEPTPGCCAVKEVDGNLFAYIP